MTKECIPDSLYKLQFEHVNEGPLNKLLSKYRKKNVKKL